VESNRNLSESAYRNVECQQDKPQYNENVLQDMAIGTEEEPKYRLQATQWYVQDS
jgi:hypothetical protein